MVRAGLVSLFLLTGLGVGVRWYGHSENQVAGDIPPSDTSSDEKPPPLTLPSEEREYLWQMEHHGNLLSHHGFRALADALRRQDAAALASLLSDDFVGQAPQSPREVRLDADFAQVVRHESAGGASLRLSGAEFVSRLLGYRRLFSQPPQVKLALMALSPTERGNLKSLWQGTCQLRMWGETSPGQPGEVVLYLEYRLPLPSEETLTRPGWLNSCTILQSQEARATRPLFREVAAERGIVSRGFHDNWTCKSGQLVQGVTGGVYLCDFDRDGYLDLLLTDLNGYNLYKGQAGGKFADVTLQVGLSGAFSPYEDTGLLAGFADLDGDGWEDLIIGASLYRNDKGRSFQDVTPRSNLRFPPYVTGLAVADFDRDGRLDLYLTRSGPKRAGSWIEGKNGEGDGNHLWRNLGNWRFQDVTASSGTAGGQRSCFTAIWFDADNDGWPDLYVLNEFGSGVLLRNEGNGRFREHSVREGPGDYGSMGATCGDIDNDGNMDLYVANMYSKAGNRIIGNLHPQTYSPEIMARLRSLVAGSQLYVNRGGLHFDPVGPKYQVAGVGWAYGAALIDLDNDGWLDLYAACGYVSRSRTEPDG
jgi:hypothetical protein